MRQPLGQFHLNENYRRPTTFYDRVRFVGAESTVEIFGGVLSGDLRSSNFEAGVSGWSLTKSGTAEFNDVTVRGTLGTSTITGDLVLDGGVIQTNPDGEHRVELQGGRIAFYDDLNTLRGSIRSNLLNDYLEITGGGASITLDNNVVTLSDIFLENSTGQITFEADTSETVTTSANIGSHYSGGTGNTLFIAGPDTAATDPISMEWIGSVIRFTNSALWGGGSVIAELTRDGRFRVSNGSVSFPSYTFVSDTNTGMYWAGTDALGWAVGGNRMMYLGSNGYMAGSGATGSAAVKMQAGTAASPVFTFDGDTNTGMYRSSADNIGFATGGALKFLIGANVVRGQTVTGTFWMPTGTGSASAPTYSFYNDTNTGMYRSGTDDLAFSTGGVARMVLTENDGNTIGGMVMQSDQRISLQGGSTEGRIVYRSNPVASTGSTAVWFSASTGYLLNRTSSSRDYKDQIDYTVEDILADIELTPVSFYWKDSEDTDQRFGLIAQDVAEQDPRLGLWNHEVEDFDDYDTRGIIAVLVAKINRLEEKLNL